MPPGDVTSARSRCKRIGVSRGRPIVTVRLLADMARQVDVYAAGLRATAATVTRSDAVRRLLDLALGVVAAEGRR